LALAERQLSDVNDQLLDKMEKTAFRRLLEWDDIRLLGWFPLPFSA
jgi:succinate dehydrogenase flavin-adding protein (antitoxin of CptAB toxin-antitoxin module)